MEKFKPKEIVEISRPLQSMIRHYAQSYFLALSKKKDASLSETESHDELVYGSHTSYIQIVGSSLLLKIKMHFTTTELANILPFEASQVASERRRMAIDFSLEFNNILAGRIAEYLTRSIGIQTGTSFPIILSGLDEVISSRNFSPKAYIDRFKIHGDEYRIVLFVSLDPGSEKLNLPDFNAHESNDAGAFVVIS